MAGGALPFSPFTGPRLLGKPEAAARLLAAQPQWLMRLGCQYHWHNRGYRDFQDFLDTLNSRKRKQMRKERAGGGAGV